MSDAPERIWAIAENEDFSAQTWPDIRAYASPDGLVDKPTEYIRADMLQEIFARYSKAKADYIEALEAKLAKAVEALEKAPDAVRRTTLDDGPRLPEDSLGVWLAALDACANVTQAYVSATITEIEGGEDD